MACHSSFCALSQSPNRCRFFSIRTFSRASLPSSLSPVTNRASYNNTLVYEILSTKVSLLVTNCRGSSLPSGACPTLLRVPHIWYGHTCSNAVRLLGPPARFEASKLKVVLVGDEMNGYSGIIPRTYILSHCDFTADLTLTVSNVINLDRLRGWYYKDDVVAEWKMVDGQLRLNVHCFVSGPNLMLDLAAEFRYHIFSKEMPLVLEAVLHGDSLLFRKHPELVDSLVWVYFHSSFPKFNRMECWGPLRHAAQRKQEGKDAFLTASQDSSGPPRKSEWPKSFFLALFAFLL